MLFFIQVEKLCQKIENCRRKCSTIKSGVIEEAIEDLPLPQREAVKTCFKAAHLKNVKSSRYSSEWIHEWLLIRIKSTKTYEHLRRNKILALPSPQTLHKYIEYEVFMVFNHQYLTAYIKNLRTWI